jgi:serine protease Do
MVIRTLQVSALVIMAFLSGVGLFTLYNPTPKAPSAIVVAKDSLPSTVTVMVSYEKETKDPKTGEVKKSPSGKFGSGFVIDPDGYIVTNAHVIQDAESIKVTFNGRNYIKARVIGTDMMTDVAVLKIEVPDPLRPVKIAARNPVVGESVVAIGSPFGMHRTVTSGVVSNVERKFGQSPYDFAQIDAAVNHGNSGGPLFDINGNLIGMNTAIYSPDDAFVGLAFAIPAPVITKIVSVLLVKGKIDRGWLGVKYTEINGDETSKKPVYGVYIAEVIPDGPAAKTLQKDDVVVKVDGNAITSGRQFSRLIAESPPKKKFTFHVFRGGKFIDVEVMLGDYEASVAKKIMEEGGEEQE